jgi:hypothetical protein
MAELHYTVHRIPDGWLALQWTNYSLFIHLWVLETGISGSPPIRLYKYLFSGWGKDSCNLEKRCKEEFNKTAACASRCTAQLYQGICYVFDTERLHATCINLMSFIPITEHSLVCTDFHQLTKAEQLYVQISYTKFHPIWPMNFWKYGAEIHLCCVKYGLHCTDLLYEAQKFSTTWSADLFFTKFHKNRSWFVMYVKYQQKCTVWLLLCPFQWDSQ